MKKIIFIICIFISSYSFAQNYWIPTGTMSGSTDWVYSMAANSSGTLFASSWAVGIYKSTDQVHWTFSGLNGKRVTDLTVAPNGDIYGFSHTVNNAYIHRSTDNGNTWTDIYTGSFPLNYAGGGGIVFPADGSIVAAFAVTVGPTIGDVATFVFKSTDNGSTWVQKQEIGLGFVGGMVVTADNKILMGTSLGGVFYSANNGEHFISLNTFPSIFIETILKAPDNTIYVCDAFGLNRSTDNGNSFVSVGVPGAAAYVRAAGVTSTGELFISSDDRKVFHSSDMGENWIQVNNGFPANSFVYSFASANGKMFSGTNANGAFYFAPLTGINSTEENVNDFRLSQNYPNPFNPSTVISYFIPSNVKGQTSNVKLIVYNTLGIEVAILINEKQVAGKHSIKFNGANYSSGTYFYKLTLEASGGTEFSEVKRMVLVK